MQRELLVEQSRYGFQLELVDVDSQDDLLRDYGHKVPVLCTSTGEEICHYFLEQSALDGYFSGG